MTWTAPSTWAAGATVTAAQLNQQLRDNLKAIGDPWTAYSVTYTGLSIGNATGTARYIQAGKDVRGEVQLTFGSTTTFSAAFTLTLPVTASVVGVPVGSVYLFDTSASSHRTGLAVVQSGGNTVAIVEAGGGGVVSNTVPFTWANGDSLAFNFVYEAA